MVDAGTKRILIPLAAPGIFIAMILVYIPMLTDFVTADIVGGTGSYMMGQRVRDLILQTGDWGAGSALNFVLLVAVRWSSRSSRSGSPS